MQTEHQLRQVIVRLLSNMGGAREIQQYLERFSCVETSRFAVVKVGGSVLEKQLSTLASSLSFLHTVGLIPIVVHGAGPQLDAALQEAGHSITKLDGKRVTSREAMQIIRKVTQRENLMLVQALQAMGTSATSIISGVFETDYLDQDRFGLVGNQPTVNLDPIRTAINANSIPILTCLGETADGQILNINADTAANALVRAISPYKIIFLTETGGLLDEKQQIISTINLTSDYEHLARQSWVHSGMRLKLDEIYELLQSLPLTTSVSITQPGELTRELFTHRGSGTLIRLGEPIEVHRDWSGIDRARLRGLFNSAFSGELDDDYFELFDLDAIFVSRSYRAAAVVARGPAGERYLDKFAVTSSARGEGLGRSVWDVMREANPQLVWRARQNNPITRFYFEQADGCVRRDQWNIFWYGIDGLGQASQMIEQIANQPVTIHYEEQS